MIAPTVPVDICTFIGMMYMHAILVNIATM
jgi:hypothetical protein